MLQVSTRLTAMSDPALDAHVHAHADRLRALENEAAWQRRGASDDGSTASATLAARGRKIVQPLICFARVGLIP